MKNYIALEPETSPSQSYISMLWKEDENYLTTEMEEQHNKKHV